MLNFARNFKMLKTKKFYNNTSTQVSAPKKKGFFRKIFFVAKLELALVGGVSALVWASQFINLDPKLKYTQYLLPVVNTLKSFHRLIYTEYTLVTSFVDYYVHEKYYTYLYPEKKDQYMNSIHKRISEKLYKMVQFNGGLYVKLGQEVASMRGWLPDVYCDTFEPCFDNVPSVSFDEVNQLILQDFGKSIQELFKEFDENPVASASLAQVHRAVTIDGVEVAVKIQYPKVGYFYESDLKTNETIQRIISWIQGKEVHKEFKNAIESVKNETNFKKELQNMQRAKKDLEPFSYVYVPFAVENLSSKRVLTMEYIHGIKGGDVGTMINENISIEQVATNLFSTIAEQIFRIGFVHADIHSGNFFVRKNPKDSSNAQIVLLDHGLYTEVSQDFRKDFRNFWIDLITKNQQGLSIFYDKYKINQPQIFESVILMQGISDSVGPEIDDHDFKFKNQELSKEEIDEVSKKEIDFIFKEDSNETPESKEKRKKMVDDVEKMFTILPIEVSFILRTLFLLRTVNRKLKCPVNRYSVMAHVAKKSYDIDHPESYSFFNNMIFQMKIVWFQFIGYIFTLFIKMIQLVEFK